MFRVKREIRSLTRDILDPFGEELEHRKHVAKHPVLLGQLLLRELFQKGENAKARRLFRELITSTRFTLNNTWQVSNYLSFLLL